MRWMSTPHDKSSHDAPDAAACKPDEKQGDASAQLAHELANLLDGGLRQLGIAISSLGESSLPSEELEQRLQTANTAMQHMAELIHRWMRQVQTPGGLFHQQRTLAESVDHAVRLFSPAAGLWRCDRPCSCPKAVDFPPARRSPDPAWKADRRLVPCRR